MSFLDKNENEQENIIIDFMIYKKGNAYMSTTTGVAKHCMGTSGKHEHVLNALDRLANKKILLKEPDSVSKTIRWYLIDKEGKRICSSVISMYDVKKHLN